MIKALYRGWEEPRHPEYQSHISACLAGLAFKAWGSESKTLKTENLGLRVRQASAHGHQTLPTSLERIIYWPHLNLVLYIKAYLCYVYKDTLTFASSCCVSPEVALVCMTAQCSEVSWCRVAQNRTRQYSKQKAEKSWPSNQLCMIMLTLTCVCMYIQRYDKPPCWPIFPLYI